MKFAVVDLETTGGKPSDGRITEIGIALMDDARVVETYQALVDPGMPIQPFVQKLTGITDEMVQGKPQFSAVAETVVDKLQDRILVAHNVQFDSRFLIAELKRCCIKYDPPKLCTVKLARKFFPGQSSYSLRNLVLSLGLPDFNHHRALDDCLAAAEILKMVLEKVGEPALMKEVKNLPKKMCNVK